jgi:hypothetical protein
VRRHLCVIPVGPITERVERWRHRWDPAMASVVPAHVTVVYPEETADESLLLTRAEHATGEIAPFRLRLSGVTAEDGGRGGVFIGVDDIDGGLKNLKRRLLAAPMTPLGYPAHVTIAHPRTSSRGPECYAALAGERLDSEVQVRELLFSETTASIFAVRRRFPLSGN